MHDGESDRMVEGMRNDEWKEMMDASKVKVSVCAHGGIAIQQTSTQRWRMGCSVNDVGDHQLDGIRRFIFNLQASDEHLIMRRKN